jgi:hypothetical protein
MYCCCNQEENINQFIFFFFIFTRGYNFGAIVDLGVREHQKVENPWFKRFIKNVDSFCIVITNPNFKKVRFISWLTNPTSKIRESGFASPILKDLIRGFVS